ncbi:MAG: integration host factor [Deltaproteobacteria bacterium RIFOXYA12_FULL_58_15]|nr:MAG: integration host factor [Deltaproteobacteria bacterium RIFOXYA12_FULL_58_15]
MTKADLITALHKGREDKITKKLVGELIDEVYENMANAIKKDKRFAYPGFGTWTVRNRKARKGRNPQTGEVIKIKASKTVGFKPSVTLKSKL